MHSDVKEILYSEQQLKARCQELGAQISEDYKDEPGNILVVGVLKGSMPFMADLIRNITLDMEMEFMEVSSYAGTKSSGALVIKKDLEMDLTDRNIIIVEDIVDTGFTLYKLKGLLLDRGAKSVKIASLLNKQARRTSDIQADYVGFEIEDQFVIGYGLDFNQKYRNLPFIGILKEEKYM